MNFQNERYGCYIGKTELPKQISFTSIQNNNQSNSNWIVSGMPGIGRGWNLAKEINPLEIIKE